MVASIRYISSLIKPMPMFLLYYYNNTKKVKK
jgi:hypothetical protein